MTASSHDGKISLGGVQRDAPSSLYDVQSDLSLANRDFQDEVHKFKAIPQLTLGLGYRF